LLEAFPGERSVHSHIDLVVGGRLALCEGCDVLVDGEGGREEGEMGGLT
jgi:hypothetical protein